MVEILRSTDLRQIPELNFIQLCEYLVVSTCKYRHIVLNKTNYKKLKSYHFFFSNVKRLESKIYDGKTYVKPSVLPSMRKTLYRVVMEFTPQCDILRATSTCPAGLGLLQRKVQSCGRRAVCLGRLYKTTSTATP